MNTVKLPLMSAWQVREYTLLISLVVRGGFVIHARGPVHIFLGRWFSGRILVCTSSSIYTQANAVWRGPAFMLKSFFFQEDWLNFLPFFFIPLSAHSVSSIFPAVWLHLQDCKTQDLASRLKKDGKCVFQCQSVIAVICSRITHGSPFPSLCPTTLVREKEVASCSAV